MQDNKELSLRQQAVKGSKWTGISSASITAIQLVQIAILGRILNPADFGLMGMITVVVGFTSAFADMGISNAIISKQTTDGKKLSSLYWLNIATSIILMLIIWLVAPFISKFYNKPELISLITLATIIFPITAVGQQFMVLMQKELKFNILAKIEILSSSAGLITAVISASLGCGVVSLILGQIVVAFCKSLCFFIHGLRNWKPSIRFRRSDLKGYIGFGFFQMGERSINYLSANMDYIMIGRFLGVDALGLYTMAYQLVIMPLTKINPILTKVALPIFSKKQDDNNALCKGYIELSKSLAFIVTPILTGLAIVSPLAVPLIFGTKWTGSVGIVQILVVLGIFKALSNPIGTILLSKSRADIGFYWNIAVFVINAIVFWFVVRKGVYILSLSYALLSITYYFLEQFILNKIIGLKWHKYLKEISRPIILSSVMNVIIIGIYFLLNRFTLNNYFVLITLIISGILVYILLQWRFDRKYIVQLYENIKAR